MGTRCCELSAPLFGMQTVDGKQKIYLEWPYRGDSPVSYRFGDPPSLNLRDFGDPRVGLRTPLSIADVNGCTTIGLGRSKQVMISKATCSNGSNGS